MWAMRAMWAMWAMWAMRVCCLGEVGVWSSAPGRAKCYMKHVGGDTTNRPGAERS